jgi:uncharacterized protein YceH (UPF0502 family)
MSADEANLPPRGFGGLTSVERRILGCLIEKELTTPQYYPLTLNALLAACNQATSRDPVVNYDEQTVQAGVNNLYRLRLAARVHPSHGRSAVRYRHLLAEAWSLDTRQLALLAVLLLRGAQTSGELKARTERMAGFENLEDLQRELEGLISRGDLVVRLPKAPGQKEERYRVPEQDGSGEPSGAFSGEPSGALASGKGEFGSEPFFEGDGTVGGFTSTPVGPSGTRVAPTGGNGALGSGNGALGSRDSALAEELAMLRQAVEDLSARVKALENRFEGPVEPLPEPPVERPVEPREDRPAHPREDLPAHPRGPLSFGLAPPRLSGSIHTEEGGV